MLPLIADSAAFFLLMLPLIPDSAALRLQKARQPKGWHACRLPFCLYAASDCSCFFPPHTAFNTRFSCFARQPKGWRAFRMIFAFMLFLIADSALFFLLLLPLIADSHAFSLQKARQPKRLTHFPDGFSLCATSYCRFSSVFSASAAVVIIFLYN